MFANNPEDAQHIRRVTYKLRQNDAAFSKFFLPLDDTSDLRELTQALRGNTTVQEVSLYCEYLEDDWTETPEVWRLFRAIGALPQLRRLVFDFIGSDGDELPLHLLTAMVRPAVGLQSLELSCVQLTGSFEAFQAFATEALRQKPLKKFQIYGCYMKNSDEEEEVSGSRRLDPIVEEIANLPTLQDVQITALDFESLGILSAQNLGNLLHLGGNLKNLVLGDFALDDEHLVAMSVALETNNTVEELSLGCDLGAPGAEALARMLRINTTLEILHLHLSRLEGGEGNHVALAQALQTNRTVKRFSLFGTRGNLTTQTQQAYVDMLKQNYTLEELEFQDEDETLQPQMDMYLKLNENGRGRLLRHTSTRDDWATVLVGLHEDLDCVHHLLSLNPAILPTTTDDSSAADSTEDDSTDEEHSTLSSSAQGKKRKRGGSDLVVAD